MLQNLLLLSVLLLTPHMALAKSSFPPHQGDSPWSFTVIEEPSDTFVVNDADSSTIDLYLFRLQGPIIIDVPIRRYVGPTDSNGFLLNADKLVNKGIITPNVLIQFPAFDVDEHSFPVFDCDGDGTNDALINEIDEFYLNDEKLGLLRGDNGVWFSNSFTVPIEKIKFPSTPGGQLSIDFASTLMWAIEMWCYPVALLGAGCGPLLSIG